MRVKCKCGRNLNSTSAVCTHCNKKMRQQINISCPQAILDIAEETEIPKTKVLLAAVALFEEVYKTKRPLAERYLSNYKE